MNKVALVLSLALGLSAGVAAASAGTLGGVSGTVTDAKTGAPVAGATVQITSGSQSVTLTTDSKGHYIAFSLQPDNYTISVTKSGYEGLSIQGETVEADQTQEYNLQMTPSS